jgi:hypothetical protein
VKVRGVKIQASLSSALTDSVARPMTNDADGVFVESPPIASIPNSTFDAALGSTRMPCGRACEKQQLKKAEDVGDVEDICGATLHGFHALAMRSPGVRRALPGVVQRFFSPDGWTSCPGSRKCQGMDHVHFHMALGTGTNIPGYKTLVLLETEAFRTTFGLLCGVFRAFVSCPAANAE